MLCQLNLFIITYRKFLICTDHVLLRWLLSFSELESQLARWLELGRPCLELNCIYCSKIEMKENSVARIVFEKKNLEVSRKKQEENPVIPILIQGKQLKRCSSL